MYVLFYSGVPQRCTVHFSYLKQRCLIDFHIWRTYSTFPYFLGLLHQHVVAGGLKDAHRNSEVALAGWAEDGWRWQEWGQGAGARLV
jgi:hypothetical protein